MKNAFYGLVSRFSEAEERIRELVKRIKNPATNNVTVIMSTIQSKISRHVKKQDNMTGRKKSIEADSEMAQKINRQGW